jgi:hypothetical protein
VTPDEELHRKRGRIVSFSSSNEDAEEEDLIGSQSEQAKLRRIERILYSKKPSLQ